MNFQKIVVPVACVALVAAAYHFNGWAGVAVVTGGLIMWLLLHFTRMMQVLKRATARPIGYVDSAVMLNAKLKPGATLLHVLALTRALGELQTAKEAQPEVFRWRDASDSYVDCTFVGGKLASHALVRPPVAEDAATPSATPPAAPAQATPPGP